MKKILAIISLVLVFSACTDLEPLNENTKDFANVPAGALFNYATLTFCNQMLTCNINSNNTLFLVQHFAATTYPEESQYNMTKRPIPENHSNFLYRRALKNLKEAKLLFETEPLSGISQDTRDNQLVIIEIMTVYAFSNIIETFGGMPYSESLDFEIPTPKYDDGLTVYKDLLSRLDVAINSLKTSAAGIGSYDNIYGWNPVKWRKFAVSLKLRMGLMLADLDPTFSKTIVDAVIADAGMFSVPTDKFSFAYSSTSPNQHPINVELVQSGRDDFVPANTLVNKMNALNDPRRGLWFTEYEGSYKGGVYGAPNSFNLFSHVNPSVLNASREGLLMDYVEVEFLLAEVAERFYAGVGAQGHYNNAIRASIIYWGGTDADADAYLAQPTVDYATATGNWREKIGTQAWIAYWYRGFSAWASWRRLDYPRLIATPLHVPAVNGIPLRYPYPIGEQTLNPDNYKAAVLTLGAGGDNAMTRLFWDVGAFNYNTLDGTK